MSSSGLAATGISGDAGAALAIGIPAIGSDKGAGLAGILSSIGAGAAGFDAAGAVGFGALGVGVAGFGVALGGGGALSPPRHALDFDLIELPMPELPELLPLAGATLDDEAATLAGGSSLAKPISIGSAFGLTFEFGWPVLCGSVGFDKLNPAAASDAVGIAEASLSSGL